MSGPLRRGERSAAAWALGATLIVAALAGCARAIPAPVIDERALGPAPRPADAAVVIDMMALDQVVPDRLKPRQKPPRRDEAVAPIPEPKPVRLAAHAEVEPTVRDMLVPAAGAEGGEAAALEPYRVKVGDTLSGIAARYAANPLALARDNGIAAPYQVRIGQTLMVPARANEPTMAVSAPVAEEPGPRTGELKFQWPVRGEIVSTFGAKGHGLHNDGINIAVPLGTEVRAAESGVVAYAGNELRGFGHLVLIRHVGGWVTAYAHNDAILVARGARVARGQVIARAGASGHVSRPQLHFEVRKGVDAVDPLRHLPARKAVGRLA